MFEAMSATNEIYAAICETFDVLAPMIPSLLVFLRALTWRKAGSE
jgi:hypothetical protein